MKLIANPSILEPKNNPQTILPWGLVKRVVLILVILFCQKTSLSILFVYLYVPAIPFHIRL